MIQVTVNGKNREILENSTLDFLLETLELTNKRIAIEMNGEIIPRSQYTTTTLTQADQLEIVIAVGGG